jgi:hypothetical protein
LLLRVKKWTDPSTGVGTPPFTVPKNCNAGGTDVNLRVGEEARNVAVISNVLI